MHPSVGHEFTITKATSISNTSGINGPNVMLGPQYICFYQSALILGNDLHAIICRKFHAFQSVVKYDYSHYFFNKNALHPIDHQQ